MRPSTVVMFVVGLGGLTSAVHAQAQLQRPQVAARAAAQQLLYPTPHTAKFLPDASIPANSVGEFGVSVAMTPGRIVAGSVFDDQLATDCGAAFVYESIGGHWRRVAKLLPPVGNLQDHFGVAVAIEDDVVVVGAQATDVQGTNSGAAYVYEWTGAEWVFAVQLRMSDPGPGVTEFGSSVAISGDTIVVGSPFGAGPCGPGFDCGAAYVYLRSGAHWRDATGPLTETTRLVASPGVVSEKLGHPVRIDKDVVAVGASPAPGGGAVYVFEKPSGGWAAQPIVTQSTRITSTVADPTQAFGVRLDVQMNDTDGDLLVIGAWSADENGTNSGAAHLLREPAAGWASEPFKQVSPNLMGSDVSAGDFYGTGVSISGNRVSVGAGRDDPDVFGGAAHSGRLYLFEVDGTQWVETHTLQIAAPDFGGPYFTDFGYDAAVSRNTVVVSAITEDNSKGVDAGAVYVFDFEPSD